MPRYDHFEATLVDPFGAGFCLVEAMEGAGE